MMQMTTSTFINYWTQWKTKEEKKIKNEEENSSLDVKRSIVILIAIGAKIPYKVHII